MQTSSSHSSQGSHEPYGSGLVPYDEYTFRNAEALAEVGHMFRLFLEDPSEMPEWLTTSYLIYIVNLFCDKNYWRHDGEKIIISFPALVPEYNGPSVQHELFTIRRVFRSTWTTMQRKSRKGGRNN